MSTPSIRRTGPQPAAASPSEPRRPDLRRDRTMEKLRSATIALAAETGIDAMTVDEIAARAGVAKGTVYNNVVSKEELVRSALVSGVDRLGDELRETLGDGAEPAEAVVVLTGRLTSAIVRSPELARLILAEAWRAGRPWYPDLLASRAKLEAVIEEAARRSIAAGRLPATIDPSLVATAVLATTLAATLDAVAAGRTSEAELETLGGQLLRLFTIVR